LCSDDSFRSLVQQVSVCRSCIYPSLFPILMHIPPAASFCHISTLLLSPEHKYKHGCQITIHAFLRLIKFLQVHGWSLCRRCAENERIFLGSKLESGKPTPLMWRAVLIHKQTRLCEHQICSFDVGNSDGRSRDLQMKHQSDLRCT